MNFTSDRQRRAVFAHMKNQFNLADDIREIVTVGGFKLNPAAKSYFDAIESIEDRGLGDEALRIQVLYLVNNLVVENREQEKALGRLTSIGHGESSDLLPFSDLPGFITEEQESRICDSFEEFMINKWRQMEQVGQESVPVGVDDFKDFSEKTGYSLDKVLFSNPWSEEALDEEAQRATKSARSRIRYVTVAR